MHDPRNSKPKNELTAPTSGLSATPDVPSFVARIGNRERLKPETEHVPSLLSIGNCNDVDRAQTLVKLYLANRDLGVNDLPEAERAAICLKVRSAFGGYDFSLHLPKGFRNTHITLQDHKGAADPMSLEKVAAIFKIDFDLSWAGTTAVLERHPPQSERRIKFDVSSLTNDKRSQIFNALGDYWAKTLDDVRLDSDCLVGAAIRHCYRSVMRDLLQCAVIQDLQKECGFAFSKPVQAQLAQHFHTKNLYSILKSKQVTNLIEIGQFCEEEDLKQETFDELASRHLSASNWRRSAGLETADAIQVPHVSEEGTTPHTSLALTEIRRIIDEKFGRDGRTNDREWGKLPLWLLKVSGGNVALVTSVLETIDSKAADPKSIALQLRTRKREIDLDLKAPELANEQKPAVLEKTEAAREIVVAENFNGKSPFNQFVQGLDSSTAVVLNRALVRLQRIEGRYPLMKSASNNVYEVKIYTGPGYRIYFGIDQNKIVILTAGSKATQPADIAAADQIYTAYKSRQN
jgi:putative addiction module killer protein